MHSASHGLMLKYGLNHGPTADEVRRWREETERLIQQGVASEDAGRKAAEKIFADFATMFYKSQADTIAALLAAAKDK